MESPRHRSRRGIGCGASRHHDDRRSLPRWASDGRHWQALIGGGVDSDCGVGSPDGQRVAVMPRDVSDEAAVNALFATVQQAGDWICCSTPTLSRRRPDEGGGEVWRRVVDVNLQRSPRAAFRLKRMKPQSTHHQRSIPATAAEWAVCLRRPTSNDRGADAHGRARRLAYDRHRRLPGPIGTTPASGR